MSASPVNIPYMKRHLNMDMKIFRIFLETFKKYIGKTPSYFLKNRGHFKFCVNAKN